MDQIDLFQKKELIQPPTWTELDENHFIMKI